MRPLLDLLVPSCCDGCGRPAPPPWCDRCDDAMAAATPAPCCPRCSDGDRPGHPCWQATVPIDQLVTLGPWTGGVARAVVRAKLAGRREVLVAAGRRLAAAVDGRGLDVEVVVAVPTDRRRVRERGADHTRALARGVALGLGVGRATPFGTVRGSVDRVGRAGRSSASAAGEGGATGGALRIVAPEDVVGRRVLVVDDVVTTGSTLATVAGYLVGAGSAGVHAATVGRAGGHLLGPGASAASTARAR